MEQIKENKNVIKFLDNSKKARIITLVILGIISLSIKVLFFPSDLPFLGDAVGYFWYANDISILGYFPLGHTSSTVSVAPPNNGWPGFLSLIFSLINSENFLDYVNAQRLTTIIISTLTIIPLYYLLRKFMNGSFAIVGCAAFIFSPRLVENSLLGLTEPLFLLLGITCLTLFLSNEKKLVVFSFAIAAIFSIVRYEGLLIIIPLSIIYFLRFGKNRKTFLTYGLAILIFLLIITPMAAIRMETIGKDGFTSHIVHGPNYYSSMMEENDDSVLLHFISKGITYLAKHLTFVTIPMFVIFIPYGFLMLVKNRDYKKWTMILFGITFLIPAFYAYSRGFEDTRYLFILYPIMCIFVGYSLQKFCRVINKSKFFVGSLSILVVVGIITINFTIIEFEEERESFSISKDVFQYTDTLNRSYSDLMYMKWSNEKFTQIKFPFLQEKLSENKKTKTIFINLDENTVSLEEYFIQSEKYKMTHLVLDEKNGNNKLFKKIFQEGITYPFLEKIYDSRDKGYKKIVKIFEIDYNEFKIFISKD
ncbi:MAG: hypothetical protein CL763_10360 [Chloroflexi bacterium]|nr:hypothetical protein [Chloroflexota bacterium]